MTQLPDGWKQDSELTVSISPEARVWGMASMYEAPSHLAGQFCWQAHRKNASLSGIVSTQAEGIFAVDQALALPEAAFIRQAAQKIISRITDLQAELVDIGCSDEVSGFAMGHAEGRKDAFKEMRNLMELTGRDSSQLSKAA